MTVIEVHPLTETIGAEITGVDLREPLSPETFAEIERALLDHLVIFFRDQDVSLDQQLAFGRNFGTLHLPPIARGHPDHPEVMVLDQVNPKGEGADNWHCDATFLPEPPLGAILKAVQLPALGGDTCFANMYRAYEALSPAMQATFDSLQAVHDLTPSLHNAIRHGISAEDVEGMQAEWPPVTHPVVRTHPVTGRKALFVNGNCTTHIEGLVGQESKFLLGFLLDHLHASEFQCRFRWAKNSIAFWDNRCVQHCGIPDYRERRIMHRVTIDGDKPY